ncbi:MAG: ATP-binding protein [Clostridia bacterium]|nr:ATP-binding protein [Clostridia bacterium]
MSDVEKKKVFLGARTYIQALNHYYVDKTLFIRDILEDGADVTLITRPRRFGKTLNMDMVRTFFEITGKDTSKYFTDKKIWACGDEIRAKQGAYPVIFLTFADVKCDTWEVSYDKITELIRDEYDRHRELRNSDKVSEVDLYDYNQICSKTASRAVYEESLKKLSMMLHDYYEVDPIILIDEYDAPVEAGYDHGYYKQITGFLKNLFLAGLKTNTNMSFAVLTGVLRITKESFFSDLNNFVVFSTEETEFSEYFGFTEDEVRALLEYYGAGEDKYNEVCEWYDGYMFGNTKIFNPWSVLNYVRFNFAARDYWVHTGKYALLTNLTSNLTPDAFSKMNLLKDGEIITAKVNEQLTYEELMNGSENIFTLLLNYGYLKYEGRNTNQLSMYECKELKEKDLSNLTSVYDYYYLKIPNKEISRVFIKEVMDRTFVKEDDFDKTWKAIESFDEKEAEEALHDFILDIVSYTTSPYEVFYEAILLGLCKYKKSEYIIEPERNSGSGKLDISLEPRKPGVKPGIIMEIERISENEPDPDLKTLKGKADKGLAQIIENNYDTVLKVRGITDIVKMGIAFSGSNVRVSIAR